MYNTKFFSSWQLYKGNLLFTLWAGTCINLPFKVRAVHFAADNLHKTGLRNREFLVSRLSVHTENAVPWYTRHLCLPEELAGLLLYRLRLSAKKQTQIAPYYYYKMSKLKWRRQAQEYQHAGYLQGQNFSNTFFFFFKVNETVGD